MSSSTRPSIIPSVLLPGCLMFATIALTVTVDSAAAKESQKNRANPRLSDVTTPKPDDSTQEPPLAVPERLLQERIVIIGREINEELAETIISQLLYLDVQTPGKDIYLYINSPGGDIMSGLAIYDTMRALQSNIVTVGLGQSSSMGSFLLAGGTKGKRLALPNTRIMLHQVIGGAVGQATDVEIEARELLYLKKKLNQMLANFTGQSLQRIEKDTDRDFYMSAQEAKAYGIVDQVVDRLPSASRPLSPQK